MRCRRWGWTWGWTGLVCGDPPGPPLGSRDSQPAPPSLAGVTVPGQGPLRPHPFHGGTSGCGCAQKRCRIIRGRVLAVGMRQQFVPVCC